MKYAKLTLPSKKLCFVMALAAGMISFPLPTMAELAVQSTQQSGVVKGQVTDKNGEPVIGATVKVKNAANVGTVTDFEGNFDLKAAPTNGTLVVSYIGFKTKEIAYKNGQTLNITIEEDAETLQEVVVVGYGTMRKKDLTGSVVQIDPSKIADQNPGSVQDLLRGTPGLQIGFDSSAKGSGASIQLRGQNSLYTSGSHNSPLIILDGMQFAGELSEINPDDIEQIDVLKDASSAAIYGAKAASGVIIISTKKGKQGKPIINVSMNLAANSKAAYRDVFSASEYMTYREDWYKAQTYGYREDGTWGYYGKDSGIPTGYYDNFNNISQYGISQDQWASNGPKTLQAGESMLSLYARRMGFDADAALVMENFLAGKTYNWEDATFRTGFNQDYNASISGATDRVNYYLGFGYLKNQGAIQGDDYHAYRANMKLNAKITDWLEVGANVNFQDRSDESQAVPLGSNYWDDNQLRESPYASRYDENGNEIQYPRTGNPTNGGYNYHFQQQYIGLEKGYTVLNTIFNAKVTLPFGITYQFNIAPRYQWFYDRYHMSAELPNSDPATRGVNRNSSKTFNWNLNNTLTWDRTFANLHHVTVTLAQEAEENRYWSDNISARNITPTDVLGFHYISGANKEQSSFSTNDTHYTAAAYLGRVFYGFMDRYMLTATVRRDGYSAFGQNNPWANFWSLGASWVLSEEKFAQDWKWLDMAKLRLSYGTNGNRSLADTYLALSNLANGGLYAYYKYGSTSQEVLNALSVDRLGNPNLEWEKTSSWNFGIDFAVLNKRLSGSIDIYHKKTHDMIMSQRLPNFTGFSSITTNLGEVTNTGFEITLNTKNIETKDFKWGTSLGFSYNKNKIKHLYYEYDEDGKEMDDTSNGWFIGKPIGEIWYWKTDGIWQANEAEEAALVNQKPGDPKVVNVYTEDDKILADGTRVPVYNDKDRVYQGTTQPPIYWNMRNDFQYKDFTFSFSMYSYMGHKSLSGNWLNGDNSGSMFTQTCNTYKKEYWTPENPTNEYARLNAVGPSGVTGINKLYNRSFVRVDNITLGYTIPRDITNKWGIQRVHVTAGIHNAFTIDSWEYGDPETGGFANRQFQFGLNVTL
ncbi:TonB-linked outer membrane protein, SusC/RagA family [Prevotella sp. khp1]|jgi:TonB-linked SusC/RagA family outer membrane protein|nr:MULTISPECIES: TonB-dependent receptor [Prevotellaceae]QVJ79824.1 TonB-dependent receptor [Xylanibacter ruminicola]SDQ40678.1 TonB-linked outer membrane protein, SusC/RagA family [Prevotella sp. khp1]SEH87421.1 TonB-linked outer membrane protein, SusC/RagA family [Xylanibacter ruminicola]